MNTVSTGYRPIATRERGYAAAATIAIYATLMLLLLLHRPHTVVAPRTDKIFRLVDVQPQSVPPPDPPKHQLHSPPRRFVLRDPGGSATPAHRRALPAAAPVVPPDLTLTPRAPAIVAASEGATGVAEALAPPSMTGIDLSGDADGTGGRGSGEGRGTGKGDGDGSGSGTMLYRADWVWKPTPANLRPYYPKAAGNRPGRAAIACEVRLSTEVERCRILSEQPLGLGFGAASLASSPIFRIHPPRRDKRPIDRAWVVIIVNYAPR